MVATGGLYAPTIRHHNGVTYIICTNVIHGASNLPGDERSEQFIIHTSDIQSGNWSDPIIFHEPGIDPSLLFDDYRVYVQLCRVGPEFEIYNMEIDIESGTLITQPTLIWKGWKMGFTEGPHIYKKDGWYYLLCAEGGTFQNHMLSIARSRDLWGPYEHCPANPLYTASGTDRYIQNTGHGDLFEDQNGNWWVVLLGIRLHEGRSIMGRETFLAAVDWPEGEWPTVQPPDESRNLDTQPILFENENSPVRWVHLRDANLERYHVDGKTITLQADTVDLTSADMSVAFIGQRQRKLHGTAAVELYHPPSPASLRAGLCLYKDEHRFLAIDYNFDLKQVHFEAVNGARSILRSQSHDVSFQSQIAFKIEYTESSLKFSFRADQGDWQFASESDTSNWTDNDFTGPVIGVFGIGDNVAVNFGGFEVDS